jgi:hypothetical protein
VFESPVGNIQRGEILTATADVLEIVVHATGKLQASFDLKRSVMYWPGLPAGELRRQAEHHSCKGTPDRTLLSLFSQWPETTDLKRRDPIDAFSIRCVGPGFYRLLTFDRVTRAVVMTGGSTTSGEITRMAGEEITFTFGFKEKLDAVWDGTKGELSWTVPGNATRQSEQCTVVKALSIMEIYGRL